MSGLTKVYVMYTPYLVYCSMRSERAHDLVPDGIIVVRCFGRCLLRDEEPVFFCCVADKG